MSVLSRALTPGVVVRPVRFTDDVEAMRDFLVLLGMRPRIAAERGGWVDLTARAGMVAVHSAATSDLGALPGRTTLSFESADVDGLCERLQRAGFTDATVYDEAYGRVLTVTDPSGQTVMIDDHPDDLYGYRRLDRDHEPPTLAGVMPVRFTRDAAADARFLAALGLTGPADPQGWATYAAGDEGWVALHALGADRAPAAGEDGVQLCLTVDDASALDDLQLRLESAGVVVERQEREFGSYLELHDPDGQVLQVHPSPGADR